MLAELQKQYNEKGSKMLQECVWAITKAQDSKGRDLDDPQLLVDLKCVAYTNALPYYEEFEWRGIPILRITFLEKGKEIIKFQRLI